MDTSSLTQSHNKVMFTTNQSISAFFHWTRVTGEQLSFFLWAIVLCYFGLQILGHELAQYSLQIIIPSFLASNYQDQLYSKKKIKRKYKIRIKVLICLVHAKFEAYIFCTLQKDFIIMSQWPSEWRNIYISMHQNL